MAPNPKDKMKFPENILELVKTQDDLIKYAHNGFYFLNDEFPLFIANEEASTVKEPTPNNSSKGLPSILIASEFKHKKSFIEELKDFGGEISNKSLMKFFENREESGLKKTLYTQVKNECVSMGLIKEYGDLIKIAPSGYDLLSNQSLSFKRDLLLKTKFHKQMHQEGIKDLSVAKRYLVNLLEEAGYPKKTSKKQAISGSLLYMKYIVKNNLINERNTNKIEEKIPLKESIQIPSDLLVDLERINKRHSFDKICEVASFLKSIKI